MELKNKLKSVLTPKKRLTPTQWCNENVRLGSSYTSKPGKYDISYVPFYEEILDTVADPTLCEIVVLKGSQLGYSQNVLINALLYTVGHDPKPMLFVSGQVESLKSFVNERIIPALKDTEITNKKYRSARTNGDDIYFDDCAIHATWASSGQGIKSRPIALCLIDELSLFDENVLDKVRARIRTYPFGKLIIGSAPDTKSNRDSQDDPIFKEFNHTDKRYYFMTDPKTGNMFKFEMMAQVGEDSNSIAGLKWSPSARIDETTWDLDLVRKTAHYVTPDGSIITDKDKPNLLLKGKWIPTAKSTNSTKRGYHISLLYAPWATFGDIAVQFLEAKAKGKTALRVFIHEALAEPWIQSRDVIYQDTIRLTEGEYQVNTKISDSSYYNPIYGSNKDYIIILGTDVQKDHIWWTARQWFKHGDSALIAWGSCMSTVDVDNIAKQYNANFVGIDSGYGMRTMEIYSACERMNFIPTKGHGGKRLTVPIQISNINPYEGQSRASEKKTIGLVNFDADVMKSALYDRIIGNTIEHWYTYKNIELQYQHQLMAEHRINDKWEIKKGQRNNHLWDCEVIQLVIATIHGYSGLEKIYDPTLPQPVNSN